LFADVAKGLGIPIEKVHIRDVKHVQEICAGEARGHVAWRAPSGGVPELNETAVRRILHVAVGKELSPGYAGQRNTA
jgi:hypothetical protein